MNEPQVWTLIGVFAVFMLGALTLLMRQNDRMITSLRGELTAKFDGMDAKFEARFDAMDAKFDGMDAKFEARFGSIDHRLEELDKEVANLATRFWRSR
ncbi:MULTISPECIES: hypothetical protein [unclassified Microbacterium]|nr:MULTISPECIES: hypothetical protein [unclassified Microbacterium]